jgi:hypothetical protein
MTRRTLGYLALACLLVLAGCNGATGPATTDGPPDANSTATTANGGTPDPVYRPPLSPSTVLDEHEAALADGGTFAYQQNSTLRAGTAGRLAQVTNVSVAVDLDGDRALVFQNVTLQGETVAYGNASVGYVRIGTGDGPRYRSASENVTNPAFYARPPIDRLVRGLNYTYQGAETRDGETVFTYAVDGTDELTPADHGLGVIPPENVTSVESRLAVREDGRIVAFEYQASGTVDGQERSYAVSVAWGGVGSTTVSEPAWVADARNATSG